MSQAMTLATPKDFLSFLQKSRSAIDMALPKHLNADRMMRLALTCFSTTPALRQCSGQSILASVIVASQLGLEPGITGQAYLIPYKGTCTLVPGWQGLVGLLNNTGRATAWTGAVFEGDVWEFEMGTSPRCRHVPGPNFGDPDKLTWAYACGKVNGSEQPVLEAWPVSRIEKHRDKFNKVGERHYSYGNFEMYARKVVLLQVLKYMPRSIELNNALVAADAGELGRGTTVEAGVVVEVESRTEDSAAEATPAPAPAPSRVEPAPASSPRGFQADLQALVLDNGFTFEHLQRFGKETGNITNADSIGAFDEIPNEEAQRLLRSKKGLLDILTKIKEAQ